ncbi:phosphatase PAP2 family protein [Fictibacillus terranigra]|uniref:Phosphatase PAP2 family protein n=1 Tax=Fictibacillus terranigra TaxID=3058424 RepID=A0ABT8ECH9_9BACL|nr:phosphatase PAP2 family protein [Fictibacillus sp. CENA-BCM004]MDN4075567.1 phosphatase PAP2 family protein [Fictibacillus sp. CENA-BCM004]
MKNDERAVFSIIFFGILLLNVMVKLRKNAYWMKMDRKTSSAFFSLRGIQVIDIFLRLYSFIGSGFLLIPATLLSACRYSRKGQRRKALFLVVNLAGCRWVNSILRKKWDYRAPSTKPFFIRYGFPSAHAMNATAMYGVLVMLTKRLSRKTKMMLLSLHIGFVSLSRVYLGIHYFTDVLAGVAWGAVWLALMKAVFYSDQRTLKKDLTCE